MIRNNKNIELRFLGTLIYSIDLLNHNFQLLPQNKTELIAKHASINSSTESTYRRPTIAEHREQKSLNACNYVLRAIRINLKLFCLFCTSGNFGLVNDKKKCLKCFRLSRITVK